MYLVMDNAGGHSTKVCIDDYIYRLERDHNVRVIWQEPRGPETNLLDLGIWNLLQSAVEKGHRFRRTDRKEALAQTIERVWEAYDSMEVLQKVYDRWLQVLKIIIEDNGDNKLVDKQQGKLFADFDFVCPPLTEEERVMLEENDDAALHSDDSSDDDNATGNNDNYEPCYSDTSESDSDNE